jgi:hypothetical protein
MLTVVAEGEKVTSAEVMTVLGISQDEFEVLRRSLIEERLLISVLPLGLPDFPAPGWWEISPRGRQVLAEAEPPSV